MQQAAPPLGRSDALLSMGIRAPRICACTYIHTMGVRQKVHGPREGGGWVELSEGQLETRQMSSLGF